MSLVLWLCSLVLIGLLVVPAFGPDVGGAAAVALLAGLALVCYLICMPLRPSG